MTAAGASSKYTRFLADRFLQNAAENKLECVLILDLAGTVQFVNSTGVKQLGARNEGELMGAPWGKLWAEPDRSAAEDALRAAAAGEARRLTATALSEAEGRRRFDSVISPLGAPAGPTAALLVIARDVTELEQGRVAAAQQASVLRSAAEMAKLTGWEIDFGRNFARWVGANDHLEPVSLEHRLSDLDPEDRSRVRDQMERARLYGEHIRYDARITRSNGARAWIRTIGEPIYQGDVCVGLRGASMDISEEIAARDTIERAKQRLNLAVQLAGMQVYELDFEQQTLTQVGASASIFDRPLRYQDMWPEPEIVDPRDRARVHTEWVKAQERQTPFRSEFRVQHSDGREVWVYGVAEVVQESGRPRRLVGAMMDITERKRSELEMLQTMAQMREHEARQKLLLDELNHRVKNTLTAVQSVALQTLTDWRDPQEGRELFIERLLALSKTHNLLVKHAWDSASLREIVDAVLTPYGHAYQYEGVDLRLDPNFAVSLGMAVHELATNAVQHGAWREDGQVCIVTDVDEAEVRITWRESGGPPVSPPTRRGFGARLLQRGVAGELSGKVELNFAREGLVCSIQAPRSSRLGPAAPP